MPHPRKALTDEHLALIRQARLAVQEQWPLLAGDSSTPHLTEQAEALDTLLSGSALYEQLPRVRTLTQAVRSAYRRAYLAEHQARFEEYSQAVDEIKGRTEWATIQPSDRASVLLPLTQRSCDEADLSDSAMVCQRCKDGLSLIKEHRQSLQSLKQEALNRLFEAIAVLDGPRRPIKRVQATNFFPDLLESEQEVEEALSRLREQLLKLVAEGARIWVE